MSRRKIKLIDKIELENKIGDLENAIKYSGRTQLYTDLGKEFDVSTTHIGQLIRKYNIKLKTPDGRGGGLGLKKYREEHGFVVEKCNDEEGTSPIEQKEDDEIKASLKKYEQFINRMYKEYPVRWHKLIKKLQKGSMKAAIYLKCVDCAACEPSEIKNCQCKTCSLYPFRPYK